MLQCLIVALRPLRVEEVAELLAFEFKGQGAVPKYRTDWRPNDQVEAILSTCSSLISIVDNNDFQVVQFSHFSVKEFLMSNRLTTSLGDYSHYQILPRPAHTILAQACLGCLLHLDGHVEDKNVKGLPLAEYAAKHWVTHAQFEDVASHVKDGMETLFDCDKPHFGAWIGIYNMDEESSSELPSKIPTPLYYSSLCGFSDLVEHLSTKHPQQVNTIGGKYKFPLLAALVGKHIRVAEILLDRGASVDIRGVRERTPLHEAIDNVGMVQSLLNKGADVNCRQDDLRTPLHLAAHCGELKVARMLVDHKADVDSQDNDGETPLHLLLENTGHDDNNSILDLAQLLLERCTDTNIRATDGCTLLHAAAYRGRLEVVKLLLNRGSTNPNVENEQGDTPLHLMAQGKYNSEEHGVGIARLLLERGVDVNAQEKEDGWTSLHEAAYYGRVEVARVLLDYGANAKLETKECETALHIVSYGEYDSEEQGVGMARLLLEHSVDVDARNEDSWTSLHFAAFQGRTEVARVLLEHGANATLETKMGETALHKASRGEYESQEQGVSTARVLLEHGVDVNAQEKNDSWTPLHWAAFKGRLELTRVLLDHGANAKLETKEGETVLHIVSRGEFDSKEHGVGISRLLLEHGVDVNARRKDSWTSLHRVALKGRVEVAQVLLDHGANAKLETKTGETALHFVPRGKYDSEEHGVRFAQLLLERGVDVHAQSKLYGTALHSAAMYGKLNIVQLLLDYGANPNAENELGRTSLHSVSRGKQASQEHGAAIARLLLERGVDVNAQERNNWTLLHSAVFNGRLDITQVLSTYYYLTSIYIRRPQVLLDHGANAHAENDEGKIPLHLVSQGDYDSQEHGVGIVRLLLQRGVDVHSKDKDHGTPLHSAASSGMLEIARVLLDHGANVNAGDKQGRTPSHQVAQGNYDSEERGVSVTRLLVERGVDVHAQDKDHDTALHLAAFSGRLEIAKLLIDHGAITTAENEHGESPLHLVSRGQYVSPENGVSIVQLLLEHGVDVNDTDRHQNTPLHFASSLGRLEIAQALLDHGAKPGPENDGAQTPLHLVSQGSYWFQDDGPGVVKLLLDRGADMCAQDGEHATPLHLACCSGRLDIARVLLDYDAKAQDDTDVVPFAGQVSIPFEQSLIVTHF